MKSCFRVGTRVTFVTSGSVIPSKYTSRSSLKEFVLHVGDGIGLDQGFSTLAESHEELCGYANNLALNPKFRFSRYRVGA